MDINNATQNALSPADVDLDLMLADLDVDDTIEELEAVSDIVPEAAEVERVQVEIEAVPEMIEAAEIEVQAEVESMEATAEKVETEADEQTLDALGAEIEVEEQRDAIYAEQPATNTEIDASATPAPAAPKKTRAASTGTPKARTSVADLPEDAFVLTTDVPADLAANKAAVIAACPAQKKVREKFENLLVSVAAARSPSTYTVICLKALLASTSGEITGVELTNALTASGLGEGTARSQSGQIMALFPAVKIATRTGNKLTLNPQSMLVVALRLQLGL